MPHCIKLMHESVRVKEGFTQNPKAAEKRSPFDGKTAKFRSMAREARHQKHRELGIAAR